MEDKEVAMQIRAKANENQIINTAGAARESAAQREGKQFGKNGRKSIFAGDIGVQQDSIALRRQRAQKKALKIVSDAWNGDRKIDQNMMEVRDRAAQLNAEKKENLNMRRIITLCPVLTGKIYDVITISLLLAETIQKQTGNEGLKGLYIMWKRLEN